MLEGVGYYEILGVNSNATALDIKRAYFATVRKYPPERFPEEFKRVREAYVTLSDQGNRSIYDSGLNNVEFRNYFDEADQAYHSNMFEKAVGCLQKALTISPGNKMARNLMGLCYLEMEEFDKAAGIFKKLSYEHPDTASFFSYLGEAHLKKTAYKQAIEAFEIALHIDETDNMAWEELSLCYLSQHKHLKAREILLQGIQKCGADTSFYLKLIFVDIGLDNMDILRKDVAQLEKLAVNEAEQRENVAWSLAEIADILVNSKPEFASQLLARAKKIDPLNKEIKTMHKEASRKQKLEVPYKQMKDDPGIHSWIKDIVSSAILGYTNPIEKMDLDISKRIILRDPTNVLASVKRLQEQYPEIFTLEQDFFQTILAHPDGSEVDTGKLLADIDFVDNYVGRSQLPPIALDDLFVPPMPRVKTSEVGRNDPCPCGSGKKYKKCCMLK